MAGVQTATATFNGAQPLSGDYPYVDITWSVAFASAGVYRIALGLCAPSSGMVGVMFDLKAGAGVRVLVTDQFTGTIELIGYPA